MKGFALAALAAFLLFTPRLAAAQWQALANQPAISAGPMLLLTDGTVMCHDAGASDWWKLTPDAFGSYQNGKWTQAASLPSGYDPLYYASAVLPDGRLVIVGGEYNNGSAVWTNKAAIYDPVKNAWHSLAHPYGWNNIGDAQCCVLPNGQLMIGDPYGAADAVLNAKSLAWTIVGSGKADGNDEEGWTLLPDGAVLAVDVGAAPHAERFNPATDTWISAGSTPSTLPDPGSGEIGPAVLRPDGAVVAFGASGHNGIYTPPATIAGTGAWKAAPDFPTDSSGDQIDIADGPACLLPDGSVLCMASPGVYNSPSYFFELDFQTGLLVPVLGPPNSSSDSSYYGHMLTLPTGQILFSDFSSDVELFTPSGSPDPSWAPTITSCPTDTVTNESFLLQGTQLNGLSQASAYGDDYQSATNYPIVRITNSSTRHVFYCRTFNHSTMAVATGSATVSTNVLVPPSAETGPSQLEVVANGIASSPVNITISHALNVSNYIAISKSPLTYDKTTGLYLGTITLKNKGPVAIAGPLQAVLIKLPSGVTLVNAAGAYQGNPYVTANISSLAPLAATTVQVQFSKPAGTSASYQLHTYSGTF